MNQIKFENRFHNDSYNMKELETHHHYEIYFLYKGERNVFIGDKFIPINEPSAIIIPPFTPHRTEGGPYRRYNIYIPQQLISKNALSFLQTNKLKIFVLGQETATILQLLADGTSVTDNSERSVELKQSFINAILFHLNNCVSYTTENLDKNIVQSTQFVLEIIKYIEQHFNENVTLEHLCRRFFVGESSLCKKFKSVLKCSVHDYILLTRLNKAKQLLLETSMKIQDIAIECGFSSLNYFSLIFKQKNKGISPNNYRKTIK